MVLGRSPSSGKLFPETSLVVDAPSAYFCPLSGSLMLEPVTLVNTGQVRRPSLTALHPHLGVLSRARAPVSMHIVEMFFGAHGFAECAARRHIGRATALWMPCARVAAALPVEDIPGLSAVADCRLPYVRRTLIGAAWTGGTRQARPDRPALRTGSVPQCPLSVQCPVVRFSPARAQPAPARFPLIRDRGGRAAQAASTAP